jgi:hypothetical protein
MITMIEIKDLITYKTRIFDIDRITIGRSSDNDLVIPDRGVVEYPYIDHSKFYPIGNHHATLERDGNYLRLTSLGRQPVNVRMSTVLYQSFSIGDPDCFHNVNFKHDLKTDVFFFTNYNRQRRRLNISDGMKNELLVRVGKRYSPAIYAGTVFLLGKYPLKIENLELS